MQLQARHSARVRRWSPTIAVSALLAFIGTCLVVGYFVVFPPIKLVKDATYAWEGHDLNFCAQATTAVGRIVRFDLDVNNDGVFDYTNTDVSKGIGVEFDLPLLRLLGDQVDNGHYPATLRVHTSWGLRRDFPIQITVGNVPPAIDFDEDAVHGDSGKPFTIKVWTTDRGPDTVRQIEIDWGDGSKDVFAGGAGSMSHMYDKDGDYTIRATVADEDCSTWAEHCLSIGQPERPRFDSRDPIILSGHFDILPNGHALFTVDARDYAGCPDVFKYEWDREYDEVFETEGGPTIELAPTQNFYRFSVVVKVTDTQGRSTECLFAFNAGELKP